MFSHWTHWLAIASTIGICTVNAGTSLPSFPLPLWADGKAELAHAFAALEDKINAILAEGRYDPSSVSIDVTSQSETLWAYHHTARLRNESRPGAARVDGDSVFRIASISKTFTALGVLYQQDAGNLHLDDPISKYVPGLAGELPWKDISLRILASQLSGLPRDLFPNDIEYDVADPVAIGLPPTPLILPACSGELGQPPCNGSQFTHDLERLKPLFAPNMRSSYSNINFGLLGLALENVTGKTYAAYMTEAIFQPLNLTSTSVAKPSDEHATIPVLQGAEAGHDYWDVDQGVYSPTGGIYSSSTDLSKWLRFILTHYNTIATGVNWFLPHSHGENIRSLYGMPWEMLVTEKVLPESCHSVTFVTKGGNVPGYHSTIVAMPEYGLGFNVLVAGGEQGLIKQLKATISVDLIRAAEPIIWRKAAATYDGAYAATDARLNSSLAISSSAAAGLVVESFVSNGTDVLARLVAVLAPQRPRRFQLSPTLLYKNETAQRGEIWRMLPVAGEAADAGSADAVWEDDHIGDYDAMGTYGGLPVNEFVFWVEERVVELPAWRVRMGLVGRDEVERLKLVVQG